MAASRKDMYILSTDPTFQNRVGAALLSAAISIYNEGWAVAFHRERASFASQIITQSVGGPDYRIMFANAVATDTSVIADATQAGTVVLTVANVAAQAALVTDAHIDTAIAGQFNAFFRTPGN